MVVFGSLAVMLIGVVCLAAAMITWTTPLGTDGSKPGSSGRGTDLS
jgi:hypothetical protein